MSATAPDGGAPDAPAAAAEERRSPARNYLPRFAEEAKRLTYLGFTLKQLAAVFDVAESTLYAWRKEFPDFDQAIIEGREHSDGRVAAALFDRAVGYNYMAQKAVATKQGVEIVEFQQHIPADVTAAFIWLKNRQPKLWKDRQVHALVGDDDEPALKVQQDAEVAAKLAALEARILKTIKPDGTP